MNGDEKGYRASRCRANIPRRLDDGGARSGARKHMNEKAIERAYNRFPVLVLVGWPSREGRDAHDRVDHVVRARQKRWTSPR
jgi:hypothetical protein